MRILVGSQTPIRATIHLNRSISSDFVRGKPPRNACLFSVMCQNLVKRANRKTVCYKETVRARDPTPDNVSSSASSPVLIGQSLSGPGVLPTNQSPRKARQKQRAQSTKETQDCDGQSSGPALQTIFHLFIPKKRFSQASRLTSTKYFQNRIIMFCLE
jgi:hypothetical protein